MPVTVELMLSRYVQLLGFSSNLNWPTPKYLHQKAKSKKPYDMIFLSKWMSKFKKWITLEFFFHKPPFLQWGRGERYFLEKEDIFFPLNI